MDFESMYFDLLGNCLEVVLIPAPDPRHSGHMIRVAQSQNPLWYKRFCELYPTNRSKPKRSRKFDTKIKRQHTIRALEKIMNGETSGSVYVERLLEFQKNFEVKKKGEWLDLFFVKI